MLEERFELFVNCNYERKDNLYDVFIVICLKKNGFLLIIQDDASKI